MKPKITIKPDLKQISCYNQKYDQSLKILSLNNIDLKIFLAEKISKNVFLSYQFDQQAFDDLTNNQQYKPSLYQNFIDQLSYLDKKINKDIFNFLFSDLDSNGYFKTNLKQLSLLANQSMNKLQNIIKILQTLEPVGCFSFDLADCLKAQCRSSELACSETAEILCDHLDMIAEGKVTELANICNLSKEEIIEGISYIRTLNPKPAASFADDANLIIPEVKITKHDDQLDITLINNDFSIQFNDIDASQLNETLKAQRDEAMTIINSVKKRNLTILQITNALCTIQHAFFLKKGPLIHCTLHDVSNITNLHPSTISRAIQNKAIEFENRYLLYKTLFSAKGTKQTSGNELLDAMQDIIANEDKIHPLSDEKIKKLLEKKANIYVSRRTITKYRDENNILSASKRKAHHNH